jgi:hypothetical protein
MMAVLALAPILMAVALLLFKQSSWDCGDRRSRHRGDSRRGRLPHPHLGAGGIRCRLLPPHPRSRAHSAVRDDARAPARVRRVHGADLLVGRIPLPQPLARRRTRRLRSRPLRRVGPRGFGIGRDDRGFRVPAPTSAAPCGQSAILGTPRDSSPSPWGARWGPRYDGSQPRSPISDVDELGADPPRGSTRSRSSSSPSR